MGRVTYSGYRSVSGDLHEPLDLSNDRGAGVTVSVGKASVDPCILRSTGEECCIERFPDEVDISKE
jgi:hypothetical protein